MTKRIKRDDPMYIEALSWMSYRYAIGITEYPKRNGLSDAERYRMFRDIEFNTEDFQAVAAAFTDFLKRKKITDIVTLRDKYRENDLIWLSRNYAMGRHSYAASHCDDIMKYSNDVLSPGKNSWLVIFAAKLQITFAGTLSLSATNWRKHTVRLTYFSNSLPKMTLTPTRSTRNTAV